MLEGQLISAANGTSDITSTPLDIGNQIGYSIQVDFSGSNLAGDLKLQVRNNSSADWVDLTGSSQSITSASSHIWNMTAEFYKLVRVSWTYSSGTGNLTSYYVIKEAV